MSVLSAPIAQPSAFKTGQHTSDGECMGVGFGRIATASSPTENDLPGFALQPSAHLALLPPHKACGPALDSRRIHIALSSRSHVIGGSVWNIRLSSMYGQVHRSMNGIVPRLPTLLTVAVLTLLMVPRVRATCLQAWEGRCIVLWWLEGWGRGGDGRDGWVGGRVQSTVQTTRKPPENRTYRPLSPCAGIRRFMHRYFMLLSSMYGQVHHVVGHIFGTPTLLTLAAWMLIMVRSCSRCTFAGMYLCLCPCLCLCHCACLRVFLRACMRQGLGVGATGWFQPVR